MTRCAANIMHSPTRQWLRVAAGFVCGVVLFVAVMRLMFAEPTAPAAGAISSGIVVAVIAARLSLRGLTRRHIAAQPIESASSNSQSDRTRHAA